MDKRIITIGRQFGAGGRSIGKVLAQRLGVDFYDKELIAEAAQASGLSHQVLSDMDEKHMNSLLFSLVISAQNKNLTGSNKPIELIAYEGQIAAVKNVAGKGPCVIVGRAADCILREEYEVTSFFISAPLNDRIKRVAERDGITESGAAEKIKRLDKARASYYNSFTDNRKWGRADSYDLCLDLGKISEEDAVGVIMQFLSAANGAAFQGT